MLNPAIFTTKGSHHLSKLIESHKLHEKGRPTRLEQLHIRRILRPFFEHNITATATTIKTGINIKTVCKYFDDWSEQIRELETKDFVERQKKERERVILSFDQLILEEYELLNDVEVEIEKFKKENKLFPRHLLGFKLEVIKSIANLNEKKRSFTIHPFQDEALERIKVEEIGEEKMKELVRYLAIEKDGVTKSTLYSDEDIKREIIKLMKCDEFRANGIFAKMKVLGLGTCRNDQLMDFDSYNKYSLLKFGLMRGYIKEKEVKYIE